MSELIANILIFLCGIVIARWIFGIDQGLKLKKLQVGLLILIAKKSGATESEIEETIAKVYPKK